jgi:hypothetical protein
MSAKSYRVNTSFHKERAFIPKVHHPRRQEARTNAVRHAIEEQLPLDTRMDEGIERWEEHFKYLKT